MAIKKRLTREKRPAGPPTSLRLQQIRAEGTMNATLAPLER
jgi:hypothetical protein